MGGKETEFGGSVKGGRGHRRNDRRGKASSTLQRRGELEELRAGLWW